MLKNYKIILIGHRQGMEEEGKWWLNLSYYYIIDGCVLVLEGEDIEDYAQDDGTYANKDDEESPDGDNKQTTRKNDKPERRKVHCGECGVEGHNRRTCPKQKQKTLKLVKRGSYVKI